MYERLCILPKETVLSSLHRGEESLRVPTAEDKYIVVRLGSRRIRTFVKGDSCVSCGMEISVFAVERHPRKIVIPEDSGWHINAYGYNQDGGIMMMTSDHIIPRSKGGDSDLSNRQVMCSKCNYLKGSYGSVEEGVFNIRRGGLERKIRGISRRMKTLKKSIASTKKNISFTDSEKEDKFLRIGEILLLLTGNKESAENELKELCLENPTF